MPLNIIYMLQDFFELRVVVCVNVTAVCGPKGDT